MTEGLNITSRALGHLRGCPCVVSLSSDSVSLQVVLESYNSSCPLKKEKKLFSNFSSSFPIKYSTYHKEIRVGKNKTVVKLKNDWPGMVLHFHCSWHPLGASSVSLHSAFCPSWHLVGLLGKDSSGGPVLGLGLPCTLTY